MFKCVSLAALLVIATPALAGRETPADWAGRAHQDIAAAHDIIRDNHPGPVDASNPGFSDWLDRGQALAFKKARNAKTRSEYWRSLTFYINGFRDGHLTAHRNSVISQVWPGFLTATDILGVTRITVSRNEYAPIGAKVEECDGVAVNRLLDEDVDPYFTNAGIPHERLLTASYLFVRDAEDRSNLIKE